jgi:CPA1 family monovalent cation:H+ antiporter
VVAPPDAIAATAVARRIGLPRRVVTILEGESLLNDGTAWCCSGWRSPPPIGAATGPVNISIEVVAAVGGGILVGAIGAVVFRHLHQRTTYPLLDNAWSLLRSFVVAAGPKRFMARALWPCW